MDADEELRKAIERVQQDQAQEQVDATEAKQAAKYRTTVDAAAIEKFVRDILPSVAEPMMSKVSGLAKKPVPTAGGQPGNQFHDDHHDWRYAFSVGHVEAIVDSCGPRLEVSINGKPYDYEDELTRDGAIRLVTHVVDVGLRSMR